MHAVLPRRGGIARAAADGKSEAQVLAANVDIALVLGSLNRDLNVRRLERMLTLAADARADAVVVLSKADLDADPPARVADVRLALGATVPVLALSVHAGTGLDALAAWLRPGATTVLLGSSGVGKTTLLNALTGGPPRRTAPIRESDDRGRHATSHRELVPLASGALVIDTPGLRLPRVWEQAGRPRDRVRRRGDARAPLPVHRLPPRGRARLRGGRGGRGRPAARRPLRRARQARARARADRGAARRAGARRGRPQGPRVPEGPAPALAEKADEGFLTSA